MSYKEQLQNNNEEITVILDTINSLPSVCENMRLQTKTVTPSADSQLVVADEGFTELKRC